MSDIEACVAEIVAETIDGDPKDINAATNLRELIVSSVKMLRLVAQLEDRYGVELEDELFFSVNTVADLAFAIEQAQGNSSAVIHIG